MEVVKTLSFDVPPWERPEWYWRKEKERITSKLPKDGDIKHYEFLEKKLKAVLEILEVLK